MREKNGVYLANENYETMVNTIEQQTQEISEKISQIRQIEEELAQKIVSLTATVNELSFRHFLSIIKVYFLILRS